MIEMTTSPETRKQEIEGYEAPEPGGWDGYPLDELSIRDERRSAMDVARRIDQGRFVLDPDFQRGFVWDEKKQSRLIESILMRIPLPVFYVAEDADGRLIVVDGRQRLATLQHFFKGELRLSLKDRAELNGKKFDDLEDRLKNRVEDCQLLFYIIDHDVPERARLDIFERVNGGEKLTRQQMRNAIYNGEGTQFLKNEAESDLFRKATGDSLNVKTMQDREFVNRFCAFSLLSLKTYKGDMDDWLARGLTELGKLPEENRCALSNKFRHSLKNNQTVFGRHAFRKYDSMDQDSRRRPINVSIFDVMSVELAEYSERTVKLHTKKLHQSFSALLTEKEFMDATTLGTNSKKNVFKRFEMASKMMQEVFSDAL
ncbi:MAG: DUF262 domain-containing protein [Candidatus Accumulibacter sp.]|jgi:hypothetical protein|nr:DUF262 domain-containing protein [Accumulibacter sp.]